MATTAGGKRSNVERTLAELIDDDEMRKLRSKYGSFPLRHHDVPVSKAFRQKMRGRRLEERRGEVALVVQRPAGEVLLHTKHGYPPNTYRMPTGGVDWGESVLEALKREAREEAGLKIREERLLGVLTYAFEADGVSAPFVTYLFHLPNVVAEPVAEDESEGIAHFHWLPPRELPTISARLRQLEEDKPTRGDWGRFRAHSHDFIHELFT